MDDFGCITALSMLLITIFTLFYSLVSHAENIKPCHFYHRNDLNSPATVPGQFSCTTYDKVTFQLIARSPNGKEVWKDLKSKLYIGDMVDGPDKPIHYYPLRLARTYCTADFSKDSRGNLEGVRWHVPEKKEWQTLEDHGFREVVPNMYEWQPEFRDYLVTLFWSVTPEPLFINGRRIGGMVDTIDGNGNIEVYPEDQYAAVRCVGK